MSEISSRIFFPVSLNLAGRKCIVIGETGDREAIEKAEALREAGADVHWVQNIVQTDHQLEKIVGDAFFVISTPKNESLSARLRELADTHKFLLCCIDQPKYGFVAMAAIAKAGPVRIAISTAGLAPRIAKILRIALQKAMDAQFTRFIHHLATERQRTAAEHPTPEEAPIRKQSAIHLAEGFQAEVELQYPDWFDQKEKGA